MKVTIIIPSYNQELYLREAIESALAQTYPCEVIVIDDGSTDSSLAIARLYETKVKVISQINKGLPSARNTGIMNATGDWIMPLDADDVLKENCVEKLVESSEFADIVAPSFQTFGTTSTQIILGEVNIFDFLTANRIGYFSMIRKTKLLEVGGYSPRMIWGWEDYHLWINLLDRNCRLKVLPDVLVMYRTKTESMITEANRHADELKAQMIKDFKHLYE